MNNIFENTARLVLEDEYDEYGELYKKRLQFLYGLILEECGEEIIDEINSFEISQRSVATLLLSGFESVTPDFALSVFSSASFGLAVEHLKGNAHTLLAEQMNKEYKALIEDREIISQEAVDRNASIISETLLDFMYAEGEAQIMSLRLKRQFDMMR